MGLAGFKISIRQDDVLILRQVAISGVTVLYSSVVSTLFIAICSNSKRRVSSVEEPPAIEVPSNLPRFERSVHLCSPAKLT